jgi:hypothetical protein
VERESHLEAGVLGEERVRPDRIRTQDRGQLVQAMMRSIVERDSGNRRTHLRKIPDIAVRDSRLVLAITRRVFAAAAGTALAIVATAAACQAVRRLAVWRAGRHRQGRARAPSEERRRQGGDQGDASWMRGTIHDTSTIRREAPLVQPIIADRKQSAARMAVRYHLQAKYAP